VQDKQVKPSGISEYIIHVVRENRPATVEELVKKVQQNYPLPEREVMEHILKLQNQGKLTFKDPPSPIPSTLRGYMSSQRAAWFWATMLLALATTITVFTIPEEAFPIVYARYILGSIFVLWLPGYSFIKALFPAKELDNVERIALSLGMSLALVPIAGLFLNYTPWGIRTTPITLSLLVLTIAFATVAILREHATQLKEKNQK